MSSSRFLTILSFCCLAVSPFTTRAATEKETPSVNLAEDRRTSLFLPRTFGRPLFLAQEELRTYFHKMTGRELPVSHRDPDPSRPQENVGIRLVVRKEAEWQGKESAQAFVIEEIAAPKPGIPLTGIIITGNTEMAVLYGVYQYLEDLGVRWFSPGEIGENVPERKTIPVTPRRQAFSPSFMERGLDFSGTAANHFDTSDRERYRRVYQRDYALWRLRNRLMFQRSINQGIEFDFNHVTQAAGHAILPATLGPASERARLFEKEPERFPVFAKNGVKKRQPEGGQICFTNEKNRKQALESAVTFFEQQAATRPERNGDLDEVMDTFPLGLSDATGICECEACARVAGEGPQSRDRLVWSFYNEVARGLAQRLPGKKIGLFAPYFELSRPPEDVRIEPNIVAVACRPLAWSATGGDAPYYPLTRYYKENLDATREAGAEIRVYCYSPWLGSPQISSLLDAAETFHGMGIRHFHVEVMTRHEEMWPFLWTLAQYGWDSGRKPAELLEEYCRGYYGGGAGTVLELIRQIDVDTRELPRVVYGGFSYTQQIMTPELTENGRRQLGQAIARANGKEKARLERFRDTWEMFAHTAAVYGSYCDGLNERTPEAFARFRETLAACEAFWTERDLQETCSPNVLAKLKALDPAAETAGPAGRPALAEPAVWKEELFALDKPPKSLADLVPLPEVWKFRLDPHNTGLSQGWEKEGFDDGKWRGISTWETFEKQGNKSVDGRFWYRVKFQAPAFPGGKRILLRFGSIDDGGEIYINGKLAYSREHLLPDDWQTSFEFDATDFLRPGGENVIAVRGYDSSGVGGVWKPVALYTK